MTNTIQTIPLPNLALAFLPVVVVLVILWRWGLGHGPYVHAMVRMLIQLFLIGYVLAFIFEADHAGIIVGVLAVMLFSASWIALRTITLPRRTLYLTTLASIAVSGGAVLILTTQGVLRLEPWYLPQYMIPLAGMIFANAMNAVSLAGERLEAERKRGVAYGAARNAALLTALIPITNSLFAVGLVSLPGMMTGQILSGVSPFIAARYQIMVMCMIFASAGMAAACFLTLVKPHFTAGGERTEPAGA